RGHSPIRRNDAGRNAIDGGRAPARAASQGPAAFHASSREIVIVGRDSGRHDMRHFPIARAIGSASGYASPAVNGRRIPGLGAISHLVGGAVGMPDIADIDGVIALPIRFVLIPEIPRSVYEYGVRIAVCEIVHDQELRMGGGVRRSSSPGIGQAYG